MKSWQQAQSRFCSMNGRRLLHLYGAVKRAVDSGEGGGRFLITGSVRARLTGEMWPGTGRIVPLRMYGLTQAELEGNVDSDHLYSLLFGSEEPPIGELKGAPSLTDYIGRMVRGGFPEAVGMSDRQRRLWYSGYVEELVHHDVNSIAAVRAPERLAAFFQATVASTAGMPQLKTLMQAADISAKTARAYLDLLVDVGVVDRLRPWRSRHLQRLVKTPKIHATDTGLAAAVLRADESALLQNADLLGRLLETLAYLHIAPVAHLSEPLFSCFHLRDTNGAHEVDIVLEGPAGRTVGIEVKAASTVKRSDAKHLRWMREKCGDTFVRGVVLHTGTYTHRLDDNIWAMPIARLWR